MKLSKNIFFLTIFFVYSNILLAQSGLSNARSMAMGGAYTAVARGVESPRWNPANLALSGKKVYRLNLVSLGLGLYNNSFTKNDYDLYNGKYLTVEDKQVILGNIPSSGLRFNLNSEVQALGISFGHIAITASARAASDFTVPRDAVELLLNGNEFNRLYNIKTTRGEAWGITSVAISLGFPLSVPLFKEFTVGGSFKYLRGLGYAKVVEAESNFITTIDGMEGSGRVVIDYAQGGNGIGVDFGAAAKLNEKWTLSVGIRNFLNYVNWQNETKRFIYNFQADSITAERLQESDFDSLFVDSDETLPIDPFTTTIPGELTIGIAKVTDDFVFAADWIQGIKERAGASTRPRLALGTELRILSILPIRAGFSFGGKRGFSSSAGFGLDFNVFSWDFAISSQGGLFNSRGLGAAFDWMFRL